MATSEQAKQVDVVPSANARLVGIKGWLLVSAAMLALGILFNALALGFEVYKFLALKQAAGGVDTFTVTKNIAKIGLWAFMLYVWSRFMDKKRNAPNLVIAMFMAAVCYAALLLAIEHSLYNSDSALEDLVRNVVQATIWIPYFMVSKRVKATFVN